MSALVLQLLAPYRPHSVGIRYIFDYVQRLDSSARRSISSAREHLRSLSATAVIALVVTYLIPGLIGHDPWKQDETYIFGIIQHMLESGDWVVPHVAGEPFMEKPPLYYWLACLTASLGRELLPLHDAARLATGLCMTLTLACIAGATRRWFGKGSGRLAVLSFMATVGSLLYSHLMLTDVPLLAGFAMSLYGLSRTGDEGRAAGIWLGCGIGVGFLAKGVLAPGVIGITCCALPSLFGAWRNEKYWRTLRVAFWVSLPFVLIWPIALLMRSEHLFMEWFWENNIGRFFGFSVGVLGAPHRNGYWLETLPWFAFPCLPLAAYGVWTLRTVIRTNQAVQVAGLMFLTGMAVLVVSASARPNYALPLLAPLSVLAAAGMSALPNKVDAWLRRSGVLIFGAVATFIWIIWLVSVTSGGSPHLRVLEKILPTAFSLSVHWASLLPAMFMTAAGIWCWRLWHDVQGRGVAAWAVGLTMAWGLLATLWLPWIDFGKSYRSVFVSMAAELPAQRQCVASQGLGESERAMLRYFLNINTLRAEVTDTSPCDVLLIDGLAAEPPINVDPGKWTLVWEGARPSDRRERLWLFTANKNTEDDTRRRQLAELGKNPSRSSDGMRRLHRHPSLNNRVEQPMPSAKASDVTHMRRS